MELAKYNLGLDRAEKLVAAKEKYEELKGALRKFNEGLRKIGYNINVYKEPVKLLNLIDEIFESQEAVEFLDKKTYCKYFRALQEIDAVYDETRDCCHKIGSDFCSLNLCEFTWLGVDLLDIGTYDSAIFADYPCTQEMFANGYFEYGETEDSEMTRVDTPEKCWEFLKKEYEELK